MQIQTRAEQGIRADYTKHALQDQRGGRIQTPTPTAQQGSPEPVKSSTGTIQGVHPGTQETAEPHQNWGENRIGYCKSLFGFSIRYICHRVTYEGGASL